MRTSCYHLGVELAVRLASEPDRRSSAHTHGRPRSSACPKQRSVQRAKAWSRVAHGAHVVTAGVLHRQRGSFPPHRGIRSLALLVLRRHRTRFIPWARLSIGRAGRAGVWARGPHHERLWSLVLVKGADDASDSPTRLLRSNVTPQQRPLQPGHTERTAVGTGAPFRLSVPGKERWAEAGEAPHPLGRHFKSMGPTRRAPGWAPSGLKKITGEAQMAGEQGAGLPLCCIALCDRGESLHRSVPTSEHRGCRPSSGGVGDRDKEGNKKRYLREARRTLHRVEESFSWPLIGRAEPPDRQTHNGRAWVIGGKGPFGLYWPLSGRRNPGAVFVGAPPRGWACPSQVTCMCVCVCLYVSVSVHVSLCVHVSLHVSLCVYTYVCLCLRVYMLYMHVSLCAHLCFVCACVCMCE